MLLSVADALLEEMGLELQPSDQLEVDRHLVQVRDQLTPAEFEATWTQGRTMWLDEALACFSGEVEAV